MQLRVAYGIQPLLDRGITGRGQTIVLPEFPPSATGSPSAVAGVTVPAFSDIRQDLAAFDRMFGLPAAPLRVVNTLAHAASPWQATGEEVADTEIVHALAPEAAIREVLIPASDAASPRTVAAAVLAALRLGLTQGGVVSLSADAGEQCFTSAVVAEGNSVLQAAQRDRVTVIVSAADSGAATDPCPGAATAAAPAKGVNWPASDPLALAVGGTSLQASPTTGAYIGETAWNTGDRALKPPAAASADCSPSPPTRMASPVSGPPGVCPTWPPTLTHLPVWSSRSATAASASTTSLSGSAGPAPPLHYGPLSSPWPTSTPAGTSASSPPPSTGSAAAPTTTRRFTA